MGLSSVLVDRFLDPRIYSPADVQQVLGFSPIGSIFDDRDVTLQAYDECSLRLAAGIDQAARNAGVRTVVFTASIPGRAPPQLSRIWAARLLNSGQDINH